MKYIIIALLAIGISVNMKAQTSDRVFTKEFKNESIVSVLEKLESSTGYTFSYSTTSLPGNMMVTLSLKEVTIKEALDRIFENTSIQYEKKDQRIILKQVRVNQTVRGVVIDQQTQIPIPGASVVILNTSPLKGDATDINGNFRIENVHSGRHAIKVSFLGYYDKIIPDVLVGSGKEVILTIMLSESLTQLEEITVGVSGISSAPLNDMAQVSGRSFTVEETKRFPVSVGDPLRLASSFAGVIATSDGDNEIVIRGNSPRGLLWKLEGVEIPSPNHFSSEGASTGGISMFSTQVISRSDFFTSAFSPEYGNVLSGVFDIKLRNGNNERRESTFQLGLLGLDIASEGPLTKNENASYLFNYRYSTLSILSAIGLPLEEEGERNSFQDFSFKINMPSEKAGTFSVFGLGGLSSYVAKLGSLDDEERYNMGVLGVSNKYSINNSTVLSSTVSISGTEIADNYKFPVDDILLIGNTSFKKTYIRSSFELNKKFNANHFISSGVTFSHLAYNFNSNDEDPRRDSLYQYIERFNDSGNSGSFQGFMSWKFRPNERLTFVNGVHVLHFFLNDETVFEPRSNVRFQVTPKTAFFAGFGLHSRIESLEYYFVKHLNEDGSTSNFNSDLGLTRASHYVVGFDMNLTEKLYFKTEAYYQYLFNVPVLADVTIPNAFSTLNLSDGYVDQDLTNGGSGINQGIEVTLERKFSNNYYFLLNGMVYESKYKAMDGISRNTRFNGNFGYNILAGKEFKVGSKRKDKTLGINLKISHAGNKRYTPIDLELSREYGTEVGLLKNTYTKRFPNYFRTDLQLNLRKNVGKRTVEWRLDIQNLTSHSNVLEQVYDPGTETVYIPEEVVFIPVLSYRIEF